MSHSYEEIRYEPPESCETLQANRRRIRKSSAIYKSDLIGPLRFLEGNPPHTGKGRPKQACWLRKMFDSPSNGPLSVDMRGRRRSKGSACENCKYSGKLTFDRERDASMHNPGVT